MTRRRMGRLAGFASAQLAVQVIGFACGLVLVRHMDQVQYGLYTLSVSMVGMANVLTDLGLATAVMAIGGRLLATRDELPRLVSDANLLHRRLALVSVGVLLPCFVVLLLRQHAAQWQIAVLTLLIVLSALLNVRNGIALSIARLLGHVALQQKLDLAVNLAKLAVLLLATWLVLDATVACVVNLLVAVAYFVVLRRHLARIFHQVALLYPGTPHECSHSRLRVPDPICTERYTPDCAVLWPAFCVAPPRGHEPAASSRLASAPHHSPLERVPDEVSGLAASIGTMQGASTGHRDALSQHLWKQAPNSVYFVLSSQLAVWLVGLFGNVERVAEVGALSRLGALFSVTGAVSAALVFPYFARHESPAALRAGFVGVNGFFAVVLVVLVALAMVFPGPILWVLGGNYGALHNELVWMIVAATLSAWGGTLYGVGCARGWVLPVGVSISTGVLATVLAASMVDVSTVRGSFMINAATGLVGTLTAFTYVALELRRHARSWVGG